MNDVLGIASTEPLPPLPTVIDMLRDRYGQPMRGEIQSPIDELVSTILSQHTSDINTDRAFRSLKARFPDWDDIIDAPTEAVIDAIRSGGLANQKAPRIQRVLRDVRERQGGYDLSFLQTISVPDGRAWLESLPGVGPKTASCVLMFSLMLPAMPVDTHVHRVALRIGAIPSGTSAERAHDLLESQLSDTSTYDAHMLMIQHGRLTCTARKPKCASCVLVQCCPSAAAFLSDGLDTHGNQAH
jgi:endonuclease-3